MPRYEVTWLQPIIGVTVEAASPDEAVLFMREILQEAARNDDNYRVDDAEVEE